MPTFRSTPERMALTAEGAFAWASGSHVWNGKIPDFAPNPIKMNINAAVTMTGGNAEACCIRTVQLSEPVPREESDISYRKISPTKAKIMAVDATKIYLSAASMFSLAERMATSSAERIVVISANIQNSARLSEKKARTITSSRRHQVA